MGLLLRLVQQVLGTPDDDIDLVRDVVAQHLVQAQGARHPVDDGEHVHAEAGLQLRVLEQIVQHDARHGVPLQGDHDAQADAVGGFVVDPGDTRDLALVRLLGDAEHQVVLVYLVGQLGDHDDLPVALLLDAGHAAHSDGPAAGCVGILDALVTDDEAGGGEVGTLDVAHARLEGGRLVGFVVLQHPEDGVTEFGEVVRRDVGGHADGDTARTVHQEVRHPGREDHRFKVLAVVVRLEVDGVGSDVPHHLHSQRGEAALGVTHGGRAVVAAGSEVALPVDERVAHRPGLGHADQSVVDRGVAVRVVVTHGLRHGLRGLHVGAVRAEAAVVHRVEQSSVHGLQAVAHLGQGTADDDRHRVVDVAALHLLADVDRMDPVEQELTAVVAAGVVVAHGSPNFRLAG